MLSALLKIKNVADLLSDLGIEIRAFKGDSKYFFFGFEDVSFISWEENEFTLYRKHSTILLSGETKSYQIVETFMKMGERWKNAY